MPRRASDPEIEKTVVSADGLRYESKCAADHVFAGAPGATMSCLLCGVHMPRSALVSFLAAGRRQVRCRDGCKG